MVAVVGLVRTHNGEFGLTVPDFPGLFGGGETMAEVVQRGRIGLQMHADLLHQRGADLPEPRNIDQIRCDPDLAEDLRDAAFVILDVELPGKVVRLNITMDDRLLGQVDRAAKALGESRSAFLAAAARARLKGGGR
jgi:predicted RNase H-like HicB family nuclease